MPGPTSAGSDFSSVLAAAQKRPDADDKGHDLSDGFPFNPPSTSSIISSSEDDPKAITGVVKYDARVHRRVFTIWRDWNACSRCKDDIANNVIALPPVGEYECPHHMREEYERIINETLAGRLIMGGEQEIVQPRDGTILISLRWYEPTLSKKQKRALVKEKALAQP